MSQWTRLALIALFSSPALAKSNCCLFPTTEPPTASYLEEPRSFGSARINGRLHAACDIYQTVDGQPIAAVESGTVIRAHYAFYEGTYALEVKHRSGFIIRYGEITGQIPMGVIKGAMINRNDLLGYVGKVSSGCCEPMLHLELYKGNASGDLTQRKRKPYQRRKDLLDPTDRLQVWEKLTFPSPVPPPPPAAVPLPAGDPTTRQPWETHSLDTLLDTLFQFYKDNSPGNLAEALNGNAFQARLTLDENPHTGRLTFVQSTNEDFSAHHFHAQYFRDEMGQDYVQHLSFVLRPQVLSMARVVEELEKFPLLGPPTQYHPDFIEWDLGNGYVLWAQKMAAPDLAQSPFHSYTESDIGSIKVAIELNPDI